jgi:hypothetical protein
MTRDDAIALLVRRDIDALSDARRADVLLDCWAMDDDDAGYTALPAGLKALMASQDGPPEAWDPTCEPLLDLALRHGYRGVVNAWLARELAALGHREAVTGDVEPLLACPCCGHRTLDERGAYEICRVCFWEDDGATDPHAHSGPNHQTLAQARANFRRLGAVDAASLAHVLPDGRERYARD